MSANNEEIRRKLYVNIVKGARAAGANNRVQLSSSPCVIFPNPHMQTTPEPKMQPKMELKK